MCVDMQSTFVLMNKKAKWKLKTTLQLLINVFFIECICWCGRFKIREFCRLTSGGRSIHIYLSKSISTAL